jgi:hypothetical protein
VLIDSVCTMYKGNSCQFISRSHISAVDQVHLTTKISTIRPPGSRLSLALNLLIHVTLFTIETTTNITTLRERTLDWPSTKQPDLNFVRKGPNNSDMWYDRLQHLVFADSIT